MAFSSVVNLGAAPSGGHLVAPTVSTVETAAANPTATAMRSTSTTQNTTLDSTTLAALVALVEAGMNAVYDLRYAPLGTLSAVASLHNDGASDATTYLAGLVSTANTAWLADGKVRDITMFGEYRFDAPALIAKSGVRLRLLPGTRLTKNFDDSTGGIATSMIGNADFTTKLSRFSIKGPGVIGSTTPSSHRGNVICLYGDDVTLRDFTIDGWGGGRAVLTVGDRHYYENVKAINSTGHTGDGGIRYAGGADSKAIGCHIESGDDALQLVPISGTIPYSGMYNQSILRFSYENCTGFSVAARFIAVVLGSNNDPAPLTASILDCSFIGCRGTGGTHRSVAVQNYDSSGDIDGVQFVAGSALGNAALVNPQSVLLARYPDIYASVGKVRRITFVGFLFRTPRREAVVTRGGVESPSFTACHIEAPTSETIPNASFVSGTNTFTVPSPGVDGNGNPLPPPFDPVADVNAALSASGVLPGGTIISAVSTDGLTVTMNNNATSSTTTSVTVSGTFTADLSGSVHARFFGGTIQGGGVSHVLQAGSNDITGGAGAVPQTTFDLQLHGTTVYDVPNGVYGINLNKAIGTRVRDCPVVPVSGATTANGVRNGVSSSGTQVSGCDLTALPGTKWLDASTAQDSILSNNNGVSSTQAVGAVVGAALSADVGPQNNSASLVTSGLVLTLGAGTWRLDGELFYDATTTSDAKFKLVVTGSITGKWTIDGPITTATTVNTQVLRASTDVSASVGVGAVGEGTGSTIVAKPMGILTAPSGGGTVTLQFGQNTASADPVGLMLRAPTSLSATRVA